MDRKGEGMGNKSGKRNGKEYETTRTAQTTALTLINERERIITEYVEAYLTKREKKQRRANVFLFAIFCIYIIMALAIFSTLNEIRQVNLDFVRMKERATREMLDEYKRQVKEQDEAINEFRNKK
jgi:hypothetical protein